MSQGGDLTPPDDLPAWCLMRGQNDGERWAKNDAAMSDLVAWADIEDFEHYMGPIPFPYDNAAAVQLLRSCPVGRVGERHDLQPPALRRRVPGVGVLRMPESAGAGPLTAGRRGCQGLSIIHAMDSERPPPGGAGICQSLSIIPGFAGVHNVVTDLGPPDSCFRRNDDLK